MVTSERTDMADAQEKLTYDGKDVPIYRAGMPEVFVALQPPQAQPYIMAPTDMSPDDIVQFFVAHIPEVEELRADMVKRFAKGSYGKCRYQTGDVAYIMGRPFQLRVHPLSSRKMKAAARGRATAKYSLNPNVSLLTLFVVHPKNYDEARIAFGSYANNVILRNAEGLVRDFSQVLAPGQAPPPVRLRDMRDKWASTDAGALWISTDIVPYPPDCLVYVILRELRKTATVPEDEVRAHCERILPGWEAAQRMLAERPEPYCLQ